MVEYIGKCSCGAVEARLSSNLAPEQFQPRSDASSCGFCREHDGVWISDPAGKLELRAGDRTSVRSFASGKVEFHFCAACGDLAYALFADASQETAVAVVRVGLFEAIRSAARPVLVTSFEGETVEAGRQRRVAKWTPVHVR
jgi:hypothetical protein